MSTIRAGFRPDIVKVPIDKLLPSRKLSDEVRVSTRYAVIAASIREVGVIEPVVVFPKGANGTHVVLDGHVRVDVLRSLGHERVACLVSTDDENCTYNHRVNRIAPIQEHRMIMKAIEAGVPEERIANALNVSTKTIHVGKNRLNDIAPEAIELLKDKPVSDGALAALKKVKPFRQVEMAEVMVMSNTYSAAYARTLLVTSTDDQVVAPRKPSTKPEHLAKLENELRTTERNFMLVEETFSQNALNLQMACSYVKGLLQNARVAKYLGQRHGDLVVQVQRLVEATSLDA